MRTLRAELTGDSYVTVQSLTVRGRTPVLTLCRELLTRGFSPTLRLEVYREGTLALTVRSLRERGALTVAEGEASPRFLPWRPLPEDLRGRPHPDT